MSALYRNAFSSMGCPCEVALYANSPSRAVLGFDLVKLEVHRLDAKYSHYRDDSTLAGMTRRAELNDGVIVDPETAALLDYASEQHRISHGLFDITARRLTRLWDRISKVPDGDVIDAACRLTGWDGVFWDGSRLKLPPGFELDLGGIVKEYAADRAAGLLRRAGFYCGYVDLGGDFHVLGPHPTGRSWQIGIRHPASPGEAAMMVRVNRGGLASSGCYERFSEVDGVRYSHFVNPRNGQALVSDSEHAAVSVVAPSCLLAGSVATLAMLYGGAVAKQFLSHSGLCWLALGYDGQRNASAG